MNKVKQFPGHGCRFYFHGRCLYEEALNPGYERAWQCPVMVELMHEFDDMLERVEHFRLEPRDMSRIWAQNESRAEELFASCPQRARTAEEVCIYLRQGFVCELRLPACPGVCSHFKPRRPGLKNENDF